jgi:hypothetical protein
MTLEDAWMAHHHIPGDAVVLVIDAAATPGEACAAVRVLRRCGASRVIADVSRAARATIDALAADNVPFVTRPMT